MIQAYYDLQALRKKNGGFVGDKDYHKLNRIIQWKAFSIIGKPCKKRKPIWILEDEGKEEETETITEADVIVETVQNLQCLFQRVRIRIRQFRKGIRDGAISG